MKLKIDEKGNAVIQDGNPVYIHADGTETPFDAHAAHVKISTLNREAADKRTALKDATDKLALFSGIEDPAEALKAMQFAASMEGKKVMDDEGLQKLLAESAKPWQLKYESMKADKEKADKSLYEAMVGEKIAASEFLKRTTYTATDAKKIFGDHFKVEDGKIIPYDSKGVPIYSQSRAGEVANIDEALQSIIDSRPDKDSIYKGTNASGADSRGSNGSANKTKTMTRSQFDEQGPAERMAFVKDGGKLTD